MSLTSTSTLTPSTRVKARHIHSMEHTHTHTHTSPVAHWTAPSAATSVYPAGAGGGGGSGTFAPTHNSKCHRQKLCCVNRWLLLDFWVKSSNGWNQIWYTWYLHVISTVKWESIPRWFAGHWTSGMRINVVESIICPSQAMQFIEWTRFGSENNSKWSHCESGAAAAAAA